MLEMIGIAAAFVAVGMVCYGVHLVLPWLAWVIAGAFLMTVAILLIGSANRAGLVRAERDV